MLKYLGVSRSGYRSWLNRTPSDTEKRREYIKAKIQDIYDQSKQNYGAPKITRKLRQKGETISERTVGKYMKEMGIKAQWVKPWTITTIDSDFSNELQNILDEQFTPDRPNAVWCSDITYIWTTDGFVYLTSIMDLFSRKIIAWTLSQTLEVSCVINTINKAKARRNTILFVQDRLDPVMAPPAEEGQGIIVFAHMELLFDDGTEAIDLFSHISTAAYDVDGIHPADIC